MLSSLGEHWNKFAILAIIVELSWQGLTLFAPSSAHSTMSAVSSSKYDEWCPLPSTDSILASSNDGLKSSKDLATDVDRFCVAVRHPQGSQSSP